MNLNARTCGQCACLIITRNPVAIRMIGLCPLLAVSTTTIKGGAIALVFGAVMLTGVLVTSVLRNNVIWRLQPLYHTLVAAFSTTIMIAVVGIVNFELVAALGIYPLLIAANCLLLSTIQQGAERSDLVPILTKTVGEIGAVFVFFILFGALRELGVYGVLLTDIGLVTDVATSVNRRGFLPILGSAPGAILLFGLILAAFNGWRRPERLADSDMPTTQLPIVTNN